MIFNKNQKVIIRSKNNINYKDAFKVLPQEIPNKTVKIYPGLFFDYTNKIFINYDGVSSTHNIDPPPHNYYKWVVIAVSNNLLHILEGTPSISRSPLLPTIDSNYLVLSIIYYSYKDTNITNSMIYDIREFLDFKSNKSIKKDLSLILNNKYPNIKVDKGLNQANPVIKYNNEDNKWQYSNNGTSFSDFNSSSSSSLSWGDITGDISNQIDLQLVLDQLQQDLSNDTSLLDNRVSDLESVDITLDNRLLLLEGSDLASISDITFNNLSGDILDNNTLINYLSSNYITNSDLDNYLSLSDFNFSNISGNPTDNINLTNYLSSNYITNISLNSTLSNYATLTITDNLNTRINNLESYNTLLSNLNSNMTTTTSSITITTNQVNLLNLPTTNPNIPGRLYNNLGVLMISL